MWHLHLPARLCLWTAELHAQRLRLAWAAPAAAATALHRCTACTCARSNLLSTVGTLSLLGALCCRFGKAKTEEYADCFLDPEKLPLDVIKAGHLLMHFLLPAARSRLCSAGKELLWSRLCRALFSVHHKRWRGST